jgi:hypothetical protein
MAETEHGLAWLGFSVGALHPVGVLHRHPHGHQAINQVLPPVLKNFETSTAGYAVLCGLNHVAMGTRLPSKPPPPPPAHKEGCVQGPCKTPQPHGHRAGHYAFPVAQNLA